MIWEGDMVFWQPAEQPAVIIVGPRRSRGPTIMTKGCSKGCQKTMSPESNHVITIITTSPNYLCRNWQKWGFVTGGGGSEGGAECQLYTIILASFIVMFYIAIMKIITISEQLRRFTSLVHIEVLTRVEWFDVKWLPRVAAKLPEAISTTAQ